MSAGDKAGDGPPLWSWARLKRAVEPRLLVVLLLLSAAVYGFGEIADEVIEGDTRAFDERVLLALRTPGDPSNPIGPEWVEELARDVTGLGGVWLLGFFTLVAAGYLFLADRPRAGGLLLLANAGGFGLSFLLKSGFDRPRPSLVPHETVVYTTSFPSGHAMISAVVYLTLAAMLSGVQTRARLRVYVMGVACLMTVAIGSSRIYLGVHYPTDVIAGWTAGSAWALVAWLLLRRLEDR